MHFYDISLVPPSIHTHAHTRTHTHARAHTPHTRTNTHTHTHNDINATRYRWVVVAILTIFFVGCIVSCKSKFVLLVSMTEEPTEGLCNIFSPLSRYYLL